MDEVYILHYRHLDGSGAGVLRAYDSGERAQYDLDLIDDDCSSRKFEVTCVPVYSLNDTRS